MILNFFFASVSSLYNFSTLAKINYASLLIFNLIIWSSSFICNTHYRGGGGGCPSVFSTSCMKPFLIVQPDITSSSSANTFWVSGFFVTHLPFFLIPVSFVYVCNVPLKLYYCVSWQQVFITGILLRHSSSEKGSNLGIGW